MILPLDTIAWRLGTFGYEAAVHHTGGGVATLVITTDTGEIHAGPGLFRDSRLSAPIPAPGANRIHRRPTVDTTDLYVGRDELAEPASDPVRVPDQRWDVDSLTGFIAGVVEALRAGGHDPLKR